MALVRWSGKDGEGEVKRGEQVSTGAWQGQGVCDEVQDDWVWVGHSE